MSENNNPKYETLSDLTKPLDDFFAALMRARSFRTTRKAAEADLDGNLRPEEGRSS